MKKLLGILLFTSITSLGNAFAAQNQPVLEQYDTLLKNCGDGAVLITAMKMPDYSPALEIYFVSPQAVNDLHTLLNKDVLQGLNSSNYLQVANDTISYPTAGQMNGAVRLMVNTTGDYTAPAPTVFSSMTSESEINVISAGRGVADQLVGKTMISPGYYASLDQNNVLTIQFFRTSNYDKGISGLPLGTLTYQCQ